MEATDGKHYVLVRTSVRMAFRVSEWRTKVGIMPGMLSEHFFVAKAVLSGMQAL